MIPHPIPSRAGDCTATSSLPASASAATHPGGAHVAGGFSISEAREAELLRAVPRLHCPGEIAGFCLWLNETGEKPTGALEAALVRQAERVRQC